MLNFEIAYTDAHTDRPARPQSPAPQRKALTDTRPSPGSNASFPLKPGAAHPSALGTVNDHPGNVLGVIPILLIFEAVAGYALFAAMAMQGILSHPDCEPIQDPAVVAKCCVMNADALIAELAKEHK